MSGRGATYRLANAGFHVAHCAIIAFVMLGWCVPAWLPWHLALILLTLACWFVLGLWMGPGYCPVSDLHWRLKGALGDGKPAESYIHHVLQALSGRRLSATRVDSVVLVGTVLLTVLSAGLNFLRWSA